MKALLSVLLLFGLSSTSLAHSVDLFPLHFQYRYEDTADQAIETVLYQSYSVGIRFDKWRGSFAYSSVEDSTGNPSLRIKTKVEDFLLGMGYQVFKYTYSDLNLYFNAQALMGTTQTHAETILLGASSESSSDKQMVYGAGAEVLAQINFVLVGFEMNMITSKNFSPQAIPAVHFKVGVGIPF